jgi:hypothetical protein
VVSDRPIHPELLDGEPRQGLDPREEHAAVVAIDPIFQPVGVRLLVEHLPALHCLSSARLIGAAQIW